MQDEPMYIKNSDGEVVRWDFYGGNLKGIMKKIPYLKKLGVNALYLNPILKLVVIIAMILPIILRVILS